MYIGTPLMATPDASSVTTRWSSFRVAERGQCPLIDWLMGSHRERGTSFVAHQALVQVVDHDGSALAAPAAQSAIRRQVANGLVGEGVAEAEHDRPVTLGRQATRRRAATMAPKPASRAHSATMAPMTPLGVPVAGKIGDATVIAWAKPTPLAGA